MDRPRKPGDEMATSKSNKEPGANLAGFPVRMSHVDGRYMVVGDAVAFGYYVAAGFVPAHGGDLRDPDALRALSPAERELAAAAVAELVAAVRGLAWVAALHTPGGADGPAPAGAETADGCVDWPGLLRAARLAVEAGTGDPVEAGRLG